MQSRRGLRVESHRLRFVGLQRNRLREAHVAKAAFEGSGLRLVGGVLEGRLHGDVGSVRFRQRKVGDDERIVNKNRTRRREPHFLPKAGVAVAHGIEPIPADGAEEGGAIEGGDAAVLADSVRNGVLMWNARMRLRRYLHRQHRAFTRLDQLGDVEVAADERALNGSGLRAIDPNFRREIRAVEVHPNLAARVLFRNRDDGAIPVRGLVQAFRDNGFAVVLAVERLRVNAVVDHAGQHGSRHPGCHPAGGLIAARGDGRARFGDFCGVLQLPAGRDLDRRRRRPGLRAGGDAADRKERTRYQLNRNSFAHEHLSASFSEPTGNLESGTSKYSHSSPKLN